MQLISYGTEKIIIRMMEIIEWKKRRKRVMLPEENFAKKNFFNSSLNSYENQDVWRAKYRYEVDGKTYYCKLEYHTRPPMVIDVYYDRTRGNKRIEPGKYSILDYVRNVLPLIAFALVFLLVNFF